MTAAADLGGYTAAEKVAQVQHQTEKLEKKAAKASTWCEATDRMELAERALAGDMRLCPRTQALNLVEGTAAHSEAIWAMFTTQWNSSFPQKRRMRRLANPNFLSCRKRRLIPTLCLG